LTLEGDDETFSLVVALDAFWGADSSCPRIVVEDEVGIENASLSADVPMRESAVIVAMVIGETITNVSEASP